MDIVKQGLAHGTAHLVTILGDQALQIATLETDKANNWSWFMSEKKEKDQLQQEIADIKAKHSIEIDKLETSASGVYTQLLAIVQNSKVKGYKPEKDLELVKGIIEQIEKK